MEIEGDRHALHAGEGPVIDVAGPLDPAVGDGRRRGQRGRGARLVVRFRLEHFLRIAGLEQHCVRRAAAAVEPYRMIGGRIGRDRDLLRALRQADARDRE